MQKLHYIWASFIFVLSNSNILDIQFFDMKEIFTSEFLELPDEDNNNENCRIKHNFTISKKLFLAFGTLMLAAILTAVVINKAVVKGTKLNIQNKTIHAPSVDMLNELYFQISESKMLIKNWVHIDKINDTPDKLKLIKLHSNAYPTLKTKLDSLKINWTEKEQQNYTRITKNIETLFEHHKYVMNMLSDFNSYSDPIKIFEAHTLVDQSGDISLLTDSLLNDIRRSAVYHERIMNQSDEAIFKAFSQLKRFSTSTGLLTGFIILTIGLITTRSISIKVRFLKNILLLMGKGILPQKINNISRDELGEMTIAVNKLVEAFKKTSKFAQQIGQGKFDSIFNPLSEKDILGNSLLEMRQSLKTANEKEEKQKEENKKQNWQTNGLARFGNILSQSRNIEDLSAAAVRFLVNYMEGIQGVLYLVTDSINEETVLELQASMACNMNELQNRISLSDGLIGDCATEKKTKYLEIIPNNYIQIKSALGEGAPNKLLLVPLLVENELFGVFEMSSMKDIEKYKINFVENALRRLAATLWTIRSNEKTLALLEQSQEQAALLAAQEEELRQNIEELSVTQDEMLITQDELEEANIRLRKNEEELENKVLERTAEIVRQKEVIERKNQDITASINYAKRIQEAMMPQIDLIKSCLPDSFVLLKPRDIVSGDFYWFGSVDNKYIIAAVDCTGHGVPGAFMSMMGDAYMNQIIKSRKITDANVILEELHYYIRRALKQDKSENQDGMDMALCVIDEKNRTVQYAGAKNPLIYINNNDIQIIRGDRSGIGGFQKHAEVKFTAHTIQVEKNAAFYIFSDGFQDQFGGQQGRKFLIKNLKTLFAEIYDLPMEEQQLVLENTFTDWLQDKYPQLDDVLVIGFRI